MYVHIYTHIHKDCSKYSKPRPYFRFVIHFSFLSASPVEKLRQKSEFFFSSFINDSVATTKMFSNGSSFCVLLFARIEHSR